MGALTADTPKPLIKVADRTLLDHALDAAGPAAPVDVNTHYRAEQIADHLAGRTDIAILHETPDILDSGGSVKAAAQRWPKGPMASLNADNVWTGPDPVTQLIAAFAPDRMGALLLLIPLDRAKGREGLGDFTMDAQGRLTIDKVQGDYVYTGAQILDPAPCLATDADVFSLRETWDHYAQNGQLFGLIHNGGWADVGHPGGIALAEDLLRGDDV